MSKWPIVNRYTWLQISELLAPTSNDASMRLLGLWGKRLHRTGIHYIWLIFLASYAIRILDAAGMHIGLVFVPLALAVLGLRIAVCLPARKASSRLQAE